MAHLSGNDESTVEKDMTYSPSSDNDVEQRQQNPDDSSALRDPEIDESRVVDLPGTGGPDDVGGIEPDSSDQFSQLVENLPDDGTKED